MDQHQIENDLSASYGSTNEPSWAFASKRYAEQPYQSVVDRLSQIGPIKETTDLNDDWSVVVFVGDGDTGICIRLSLVGRYATINDASGSFLPRDAVRVVPLGGAALGVLDAAGVEFLGPDELKEPVRLGDMDVCLYEALFSSDEAFVP
jgi:hypothetical protein